MDSHSAVQVTCSLVVLCLVLAVTGGERNYADGQNIEKTSWLCGGKGCLHSLAAELPERPPFPSVSRVRRQTVEVRDPPSHRVPCTREEKKQTACLNGQCYALDLSELRKAFCQCPAKWEGDRCEQLSLDYFLLYSAEFQKAMIIGGVVIAIIIIIVVISIYCSFRKGKKKRKAALKRDKDIEDGKEEIEPMNANGDSAV